MTAVRVNEARILATAAGADWWVAYRERAAAAAGRVAIVTASLGGDLVDIACDDLEHATWLAGHAQAEGVPATALQVIR